MLRLIFTHLPERRAQLLGILALTLIQAMFASVSIATLIPLTQAVLGSSTKSIWFLRYVPEGLLARPDLLFVIFGGLLILKVLVAIMCQSWSGYLTEKLRTEWQITLAERLIYQPYALLVRGNRGAMISDLTQQTTSGASFVLRYLGYASNAIVLSSVICAMALVQWQVAILVPLLGLAGWYTIGRLYYRWAHKLGRRAVTYNRMLTSELTETLSGVKDVKITTSEPFKIANIKHAARLSLINKLWTRMAGAVPTNGAELVFGLGIIVVFAVVGPDREHLNRILPVVVFFSAGLARALMLAANVLSLRFAAVNQLPAFLRVTTQLLYGSNVDKRTTGGLPICRIETPIRFEGVSFSYDPATAEEAPCVLQNLDFELPLGKIVCLFGASGSGKTTIVDLIMRLYEVEAGRITANGRDIREFDLRAWRHRIGYVGQDPYLFHGTIEDNIRLGDEAFTPDELRMALANAAALEFVEGLPQGLETFVGSQGAALSGGQKRRIALARALVRNPSLLILDETTNALDEDMERDLIASLSTASDLMILLISHRAVSAQWAHLSFALGEGRLRPITEPKIRTFGPVRAAST
jgi:subfamily B ATP-binding cassette protein MsbA